MVPMGHCRLTAPRSSPQKQKCKLVIISVIGLPLAASGCRPGPTLVCETACARRGLLSGNRPSTIFGQTFRACPKTPSLRCAKSIKPARISPRPSTSSSRESAARLAADPLTAPQLRSGNIPDHARRENVARLGPPRCRDGGARRHADGAGRRATERGVILGLDDGRSLYRRCRRERRLRYRPMRQQFGSS